MTERIASRYRRLFEVRLLHHYWLDQGATVFDRIADPATKEARLLSYDMRAFLAVAPTAATEKSLSAQRCLFRETALGLVVAAPEQALIPADTVFEFVVATRDSELLDYTSLTLRPRRIHEIVDATDNVLYRYKENVPLLSNLTGATRGAGANTRLFLSREIPAQDAGDPIESLVLGGSALLQLTSDGPGASVQQIAAQSTDLPVFVHQADAPLIVAPAGLVDAPARGVRLSADVPDDVFALISLQAVRADNAAFSFVDAAGAPKASAPVYEVHFRNRSTLWTYLDKTTGAVESTEANPLPLTFFGNAGTKQKPPRGFVKAQADGTRVTQLISEIYV
jgi:hypothetical protein